MIDVTLLVTCSYFFNVPKNFKQYFEMAVMANCIRRVSILAVLSKDSSLSDTLVFFCVPFSSSGFVDVVVVVASASYKVVSALRLILGIIYL